MEEEQKHKSSNSLSFLEEMIKADDEREEIESNKLRFRNYMDTVEKIDDLMKRQNSIIYGQIDFLNLANLINHNQSNSFGTLDIALIEQVNNSIMQSMTLNKKEISNTLFAIIFELKSYNEKSISYLYNCLFENFDSSESKDEKLLSLINYIQNKFGKRWTMDDLKENNY